MSQPQKTNTKPVTADDKTSTSAGVRKETSKSLREVVMRRQISNKGTESVKLPGETRRAKADKETPSLLPSTPPTDTSSPTNVDEALQRVTDWRTEASPSNSFPQSADVEQDTRLSLSPMSDTTKGRRCSLLVTSTRRTGVEMDLATKQANELLQAGKEALELSLNMKKEYKQTATDSLQSLYEIVLALSDSRARHKCNLETERAKHAREIVNIERAHNKAITAITQTLAGKLEEAGNNISATLTETKEVRKWLGYETMEPHRQIKQIKASLGPIETGIEKLLQKPENPKESNDELQEILQEHRDLKNTVKSLSNQIDEFRRENNKVRDQLQRIQDTSGKALKHLEKPPTPPPALEPPAELKEIKEMIKYIQDKPTQPHPENTTLGDKQLKENLLPITGTLEIVTSEIKAIKEKLGKPTTPTKTLQEEMDAAEGRKATTSRKPATVTYARVAAAPAKPQPRPNHTLIVSSNDPTNTGDTIIKRIVAAIDAKKTGAKVNKVRKARNQKVVLSCHTKEDLRLVQEKMKGQQGLKVEVARPANPLIIIRDVLAYHTDTEIIEHILAQNADILKDHAKEAKLRVRYRKRARNPLECHPIIELSPEAHKAVLEAGHLFIGLQRRPVADQSPLMQCIKCLGFGHTKTTCQEKDHLCSHCGGPHTWQDCKERKAGRPPTCINCKEGGKKEINIDHNAFSAECYERHKWDAIARSKITYC